MNQEQEAQLFRLAVAFANTDANAAEICANADALVKFVDEIADAKRDVVTKRMTGWADQLEKEGPTGRFIAAEVRDRLKGHGEVG